MRVSLTDGMIAADFLGDPTGTGLDMPSQTHRASGGLTAGSCGPFLFDWAWNALGWSGMTLAIDGRADVQKGRDVLRQSCGLRDAGRDGVRDAAAGGRRDPSIGLTGYPA